MQAHVVDGSLKPFECVELESQLFRGVMCARCYPFDMPKRRFHSFNPKVCKLFFHLPCQYMSVSYQFILVCSCIYHDILFCVCRTLVLLSLCTLTALRNPYSIEESPDDVPLKDCWYARPQLFFKCVLRPKDGRLPKNRTYRIGPDDLAYYLVFLNSFEELPLPISNLGTT